MLPIYCHAFRICLRTQCFPANYGLCLLRFVLYHFLGLPGQCNRVWEKRWWEIVPTGQGVFAATFSQAEIQAIWVLLFPTKRKKVWSCGLFKKNNVTSAASTWSMVFYARSEVVGRTYDECTDVTNLNLPPSRTG